MMLVVLHRNSRSSKHDENQKLPPAFFHPGLCDRRNAQEPLLLRNST